MNTPGRIKFSQLPALSEVDDSDEVLFRDVDGEDPAQQVGRLSIATLRAAMGGGSPDRIESASGDAFVESTDDFLGAGVPGSAMIAESNGASGLVATYPGHAGVRAGPEGIYSGGAGFDAAYDPASDEYTLRAHGAPLEIEEPVASNHAATKGYVDSRPGAEEWSEHPATQDVDMDGHKLTGLGAPTEEDDAATKAYVDAQAGPSDRIESESGDAYVESTDDFTGLGVPASIMRTESNGAAAQVFTYADPGNTETIAAVSVGPEGNIEGIAGFAAEYDASLDAYSLWAGGAPLKIEEPTDSSHAATKGYVDSIAGLAASIAEGELPLTRDTGNDSNVSAAAAGPLRFTRIGRTVTLSGLIQLTADSAGAATAAFTGIAGAALPATNNTWRGIISDQTSGATKNLNIMVYAGASGFRYTVVGAGAGASYRISFVMVYRSAA